jgi:hypothetical protein
MLHQIKLLPKINTIRNKVVYVHTRQSDNLPFYIGIGSHKRPFHITGRNTHWNETHTTHGMNPPEIIHKNLLEWAAISIELALISSYKKQYGQFPLGTITNLTNGGSGSSGYKHSPESKIKNSNNKKSQWQSPQFKSKIQQKLSGHNNPSFNKTAHLSPSFQGHTIGYNQTHIIILAGNKEIKEHNFSTSNISSCINGSRTEHKQFKWIRSHTIPEELLHLVPFNDLSKQRLHAPMHRSQS